MNGMATIHRLKQRRQAKVIAQATEEAFGRLQSQLSYVESVACGFAWDLAVNCLEGMSYPDLTERTHENMLRMAIGRWERSLRELAWMRDGE